MSVSYTHLNTPLPDEFGHDMAQQAANDTLSGVILLAKVEIADSVAAVSYTHLSLMIVRYHTCGMIFPDMFSFAFSSTISFPVL